MLTKEEKDKLQQEEIFRNEVRKSLEKNTVLSFLNSAFGIWILSSLVIGLFTYFFNDYITKKKEYDERVEKIQKIDLEIANRISQFWVCLNPIVNSKDATYPLMSGIVPDTLTKVWMAFKNPSDCPCKNGLILPMYKEFNGRTTVSLMIELASILEKHYNVKQTIYEPSEKNTNSTNLNDKDLKEKSFRDNEIHRIEKAAVFINSNFAVNYSPANGLKDFVESFRKETMLGRWDKLTMPFTDCPFCSIQKKLFRDSSMCWSSTQTLFSIRETHCM